MARHRIEIELPATILHKDARFTVYSDGAKLGELHVSQGTIDWKPVSRQRPIRHTWERFARLMESR
ncbi:MAG: hypothetical protein EXR65_01505 [Dehalococcoidia bacterium]|nr:hypothetical protein [Dehalococcoidia bacterium]